MTWLDHDASPFDTQLCRPAYLSPKCFTCSFEPQFLGSRFSLCVLCEAVAVKQAYRNNFVFSSCVSSYSQPMYNKQASINSMQKTSDHEIRGTKEALIQDLEKKLRCKDNLLQNGNQVRETC